VPGKGFAASATCQCKLIRFRRLGSWSEDESDSDISNATVEWIDGFEVYRARFRIRPCFMMKGMTLMELEGVDEELMMSQCNIQD
jgi:hypothetical protein